MRQLKRLHMEAAFRDRVELRRVDLEEGAVVTKSATVVPESEHHIKRLGSSGATFTRIEPHQHHVRRNTPKANAPLKAPSRQVIEHGDAMCEIDRFMHAEQGHASAESDAFCQRQRFGNQQVGCGGILPFLSEMLAEPSLLVADLIRQNQLINVAIIAIGDLAIRRMQRHHEQAKFHG